MIVGIGWRADVSWEGGEQMIVGRRECGGEHYRHGKKGRVY